MSTANGGSLDDCITNLFALTELNGLQWRQYESPPWSGGSDPKTILQSEPIFVAYSKLQTDGILSVWRRQPAKEIPPVFTLLPVLNVAAPKELWVFWYGNTEPEEIEKHCKDLVKYKRGDDEPEDGTVNAIPYDVRCLLYKAWNTQVEKHYRSKKFLQVGRWFFRPHKFLDPNYAFIIDDFAPAHCHSFNIVGGNSMCMAIKVQMQPNLVQLAPFHIERNKKMKDEKINVLLAPWSLNGHINLAYSILPMKKEEEEVEKQLSQWKEANMFVDVKKRKKRRREEGGETEGEDSDEEAWGKEKMPKMIRVEVDGGVRMWWPTQYVLVTLEETRKLVRERFPVADDLKSVPEKEPKFAKNRFMHLTSSETSFRISQSVVDDGNLKKGKPRPVNGPPDGELTVYSKRRFPSDLSSRKSKKKEKLSYVERTENKLKNEAGGGLRVRVSSVSDDGMEDQEAKEQNKQQMKRQLKKMMKSRRYNWRGANGRGLSKKDTELKSFGSSSSDGDEGEKDGDGEEREDREWREGSEQGPDRISRDVNVHVDNSTYHFNKSTSKRRQKSNGMADEERLARSPFTPVRVLSPIDRASEIEQMAKEISVELLGIGKQQPGAGLSATDILSQYGQYYDVTGAETPSNLQYKKYHSRRQGPRVPPNHELMAAQKKEREARGRSMLDEILLEDCSSDDGRGNHICRHPREITPDPVKPVRLHFLPHFETALVGGVNLPPVLEIKPDKVIRKKPSPPRPVRSNSLELPKLDISSDFMEFDSLKDLESRGYDYGSDEEPSDDRQSIGSVDLLQPLSVAAAADDPGEGTSSGTENWRENDDVEMMDDYTNMDSSGEIMDCMPPNSDSVLSPPASNERADSMNSMYHRLPGGPHSVGDSGALNKIYPTPPSLLQVDICSPAPPMGGPHSQAMREERDDEISSPSSEDEVHKFMHYMDEIENRDAKGDTRISHLHNGLYGRKFFDNVPKADVPLSNRFGAHQRRQKVYQKVEIALYNKRDGEKKEQIAAHHADALVGIDNFANRKGILQTTAAATGAAASQHTLQPQPHPSFAAHHQMQQQQQMQQFHQSQPGPSTMAPPQPHLPQMQTHPAYIGGPGQMGAYPGQPGVRGQYPPGYGGAGGMPGQQHPMQQPGFPPQQQQHQQPPQYMGGGQMMMGGQPGQPPFHPGAVQMRPPGYPGYPPGAVPSMAGVHPSMQTQPGMAHPAMGYPAGMQNQMVYRGGMPQGSYPPQYAGQMGQMMGAPNGMAGMQMAQFPGAQMQQPGMMMQPMQHGQPMIAGAPHPMGMPGSMVGHPSFPMAAAAPSTASSIVPPSNSVMSVASTQRTAQATAPSKRTGRVAPPLHPKEVEILVETRRGEDPYVNSLAVAPKRLFYKGNLQLRNEFELYTTERILETKRKTGDRLFGPPVGGSEGLSIVAVVMLQDTILNLHFDWVFDSCPICACTTSIRSRELGVYIKPPEVLEESVEVQNTWVGPWNGFHSDTADTTCQCGFSVIRHRQLSMRAGLFLEDSVEATGDENSGTNPVERCRKSLGYLWFDPSSPADKALVETLRSIALTTDIGRFVAAIKNISSGGERRRRGSEKIPTVGSIGSEQVEYVISQLDKTELILMGNAALYSARINDVAPSVGSVGESPYFHPWGIQIASEVADPTEMEIKNLLEDVKPLIEGAVREARKVSSSFSASVIEGPLTWRSLAAKNVKSSGNGDDDSHIAEPIPLIEMSTEKEAIRVAPTVMKNWEQFSLGPIDVPKDVLYLAVVPDDDRVYDMTVVYMRRLSKMYEQSLRLGRHVGYLVRDEPTTRNQVREGIVRAGSARPHYPPSPQSPSLAFIRNIEKFAATVGCSKEFTHKLMAYVQCIEDVLSEHLGSSRIYERDAFRECVAYALYNRRIYQKQKSNNPRAARHEQDTEEGSPPAGEEEERERGRKESQMMTGPLAEALGMTAGSKGKKKAKRPFGQNPPYGMDCERLKWPDEEPAALPQTVVIYLTLWPCWGSEGRDGEAARVATIAIVKAFNAVLGRLKSKQQRALCQLELVPVQRLEEAVGGGADLDRLDRSSNLNTWQIGNMNRNGEVYPTDRPRIEDILKEVALGVYRKPRFLHCESLKSSLPKSMTKFGPASATLDWIDKNDGKKKTIYRCQSVPFQLANTPAIVAKSESKHAQLCMDEVSLYISYCLVATDFIVVTLTDNLGARNESAVLNLKPKATEMDSKFRSRNKTSVRDGLDRLWKFIEGAMLNESKPLRLVIGKLGKMGHGEFKAWCHVLSRSNLKKYTTRMREGCPPCNANAGAPILLSACLVSTEPEAHLQVLPSYSLPSDPSAGAQKKIRPLHTPGDNTITHIMVFPVSPNIVLCQSTDQGVDDDGDAFGDLDVGVGEDMNDIMNELMTGEGEDGERPSARNQHMNSFFDSALESQMQNQPLAAGWMISTAPGGDLPDWFWSSCPSLKRRLPVHLRSSLHLNESQLSRSDDIAMKKEKEQEISHALDSTKTDEVLRHVLEQYNDLSWLALDSITQERRSCLPIHIQALTRLHDTVLNLIM